MTDSPSLNFMSVRHPDSRFEDADFGCSVFRDVNLAGAMFEDVALTGAVFRNVCLGGATIEDANLDGLRIHGVLVTELLRVYAQARSADTPTTEDTMRWQRRLASQANNRAWALAEQTTRTADEDEQMLDAAHAAMHFWNIVGTDNNKAHAEQLLAHVYAMLRQPDAAARYLARSQKAFLSDIAAPWERALAHAVAANVAAARGDANAHRQHYDEAVQRVAALADPEERAILEPTLKVLPAPGSGTRSGD